MDEANKQLEDAVRSIGWWWLLILPVAMLLVLGNLPQSLQEQFFPDIWERIEHMLSVVTNIFVFFGVGVCILSIIRSLYISYRETKEETKTKFYQWLPHEDETLELQRIPYMLQQIWQQKRSLWHRILFGKESFTFLIYNDADDQVSFYLGIPPDRKPNMLSTVKSYYKQAELFEVENDIPLPTGKTYKRQLYSHYVENFKKMDMYDALDDCIDKLHGEAWIEIRIAPDTTKKLKRQIASEDRNIRNKMRRQSNVQDNQIPDSFERDDNKATVRRLSQTNGSAEVIFDVVVHVEAKNKITASDSAMSLVGATRERNQFTMRRTPYITRLITRPPYYVGKSTKMTASELAVIFHLPFIEKE